MPRFSNEAAVVQLRFRLTGLIGNTAPHASALAATARGRGEGCAAKRSMVW
jgi:hypothetical protein